MRKFTNSARALFLAVTMATVIAAIIIGPVAIAADLRSNILPKRAISSITVTGNDNTAGQIIDRLGFESVTCIIETADLLDTNMTLTPTLYVCALDNCDDAAAAAASALIGTVAGATFAATDDNTVKSFGYNGMVRYVRLNLVAAANSDNATFSAVCILGHPKYAPAQ